MGPKIIFTGIENLEEIRFVPTTEKDKGMVLYKVRGLELHLSVVNPETSQSIFFSEKEFRDMTSWLNTLEKLWGEKRGEDGSIILTISDKSESSRKLIAVEKKGGQITLRVKEKTS